MTVDVRGRLRPGGKGKDVALDIVFERWKNGLCLPCYHSWVKEREGSGMERGGTLRGKVRRHLRPKRLEKD